MSTTAREIDIPQLCATQLVARPGSLPTITVPMMAPPVPDVAGIWEYLSAPAEFFGVPMPECDELAAVISARIATVAPAPTAVSVTIGERNGVPHILVSSSAVTPMRPDAVRIDGGDPMFPAHQSTDPWWRRMAARTTSKGDVDQLERWLNGRGFADVVVAGVPLLGALVALVGDDVVGVDNPEPTSVLDKLQQCGALAGIRRVAAVRPSGVERVWWISPRFETHPVTEIDGVQVPIDHAGLPPFVRWS